MIYEEDIIKLKHYLSEYTKHFDTDDIAVFIYSYLGHTDIDSSLKRSMRKYDVLLEEVKDIVKKFFTEANGEPKRYITANDLKVFIALSALENGIADLLNSGLDTTTVTHVVSVYLRTGNFNVIPDPMVKESFSNVGVLLMKEALLLTKTYRVSEMVNKVNERLNPEKAEPKTAFKNEYSEKNDNAEGQDDTAKKNIKK